MNDIKFLDRKFGIFCESHPTEFHDTLSFSLVGEKVQAELFIRFDEDENDYFGFGVDLDDFKEFEKIFASTGESYLKSDDGNIFVAMKIIDGRLYFQAKIMNPEYGYINDDWHLIRERR